MSKSPEFINYIQDYMLRYARKRVHDIDKAEDIVQAAWAEAMKTVDFSRSDNEVRDYMIESVKLIIKDDWRRTHATGTDIHAAKNTIHMSELEYQKNKILDEKAEYSIPYNDHQFEEFEVFYDITNVINSAFDKLEEVEQKFVRMIMNGFSPAEASEACGHAAEERWGYFRLKKIRDSFAARQYMTS